MHDIERYKLRRSLHLALQDVDKMKEQLAIIRDECRKLEVAMRELRINSCRNRLYRVPDTVSEPC